MEGVGMGKYKVEIILFIIAMGLFILVALHPPKDQDGNVVNQEQFNQVLEQIPGVISSFAEE